MTTPFLTSLVTSLNTIATELLDAAKLNCGDVLVLGMSSSEILGHHIGRGSNAYIGRLVVATLLERLRPLGIALAVQGCEHINRALVVERAVQRERRLELVSVTPALHAGGAGASAAYALADDPVVVASIAAEAGLDIGDTSVGQYVRRVQVPVRPSITTLGQAHVVALRSRPPLIGGERATYTFDRDAWARACDDTSF